MALLNEEQTLLHNMAQEWVKNEHPITAFRRLRNEGRSLSGDSSAFANMVEMGWTGIIIPEGYGGSEFGYLSLGLIAKETGRNLVATPLLPSCLDAASAIILGGTEAQKQKWLPGLAAGQVVATLAVDEGPRHDPSRVEARAERTSGGWKISGLKRFVAEGDSASLFIVAARTDGGVALFLVPADLGGVKRHSRQVVDARSHADIELDQVLLSGDGLLGSENGQALLDQVLDRARAGVAAEMLGLAEQAFETTLEYLKMRVQFNQVLASFQSLQHRCASLFTQVELLRSAVEDALSAIDAGRLDVPEAVMIAKATACDVVNLATREMVQLHGGIGMTDEHDAGLYLKRARVLEARWGNAAYHRERFGKARGF